MKKEIFIYIVLVLLSTELLGQSYSHSFKKTQIIRREASELSEIDDLDIGAKNVSIVYKDELGRPIQVVNKQSSPNRKDLVKFWVYDEAGRTPINYSAYVDNSTDGKYKTSATYKQADFYLNTWGIAHTTKPYSKSVFENSPMSRILEQGSVGTNWQPIAGSDEGKTKKFQYTLNKTTDILKIKTDAAGNLVIDATDKFYATDKLYYYETTDEDDKKLGIYSDQLGRDILKISYANAGGDDLYTYYVYDVLNRLSYIVTPRLADELETMASASLSWNDNLIKEFTYGFKYDSKGRLVEKLVSGAEPIYYVYDNFDRIILEQEGNLRLSGKWKFIKYDIKSRPVIEGVITKSIGMTVAQVQAEVDTFYANGQLNFERPDPQNPNNIHTYSNDTYPVLGKSSDVYRVSYYDDYLFDTNSDVAYSGDGIEINKPYGLQTGFKVKVLGKQDTWLLSAFYYNDKFRLIQTCEQNHLGGIDRQAYTYEFDGTMVMQDHKHNVNGSNIIEEFRQLEHDHMGRLKNLNYWVGDRDDVFEMYSNTFNELGQLTEKNILPELLPQGLSSLQSIDYKYNVRGWLTNINQSNINNINTIIDFDEVLAPDEFVKGIIVKSISFEVKKYDDGMISGKQSLIINISDIKKLEIAMINDTSSIRYYQLDEKETSMVYEKFVDSVTFAKLLGVLSMPYVFDMAAMEFNEYDSKQMIANGVSEEVEHKLYGKGINDSVLVDKISEQILEYFYKRTALLFFNEDKDDIFGMDILYDEGFLELGSGQKYNGLISGIKWQSKIKDGIRGFGFNYDGHNQFTAANYGDKENGIWSANNHYSVSNISYDANGNIQSLKRKGQTGLNGGVPIYGEIDDLQYLYYQQTNQLKTVDDQSGFVDPVTRSFEDQGSVLQIEYDYDANGNLTKDLNKGISNITYNIFNKVEEVTYSDGRKLLFNYGATGKKLAFEVYDDRQNLIKRNDYVANFVYENQQLNFILTEEGRIINDNGTYKPEFFFKDYLGNVREVYKKGASGDVEIVEEHHYYPYGMLMSGLDYISSPKNNYLYQQKEFFEDYGFDLHYFNARMFDSQLGRFHSNDPLIIFANPYNGMGNNPVSLVDPTGMGPTFWERVRGFFGVNGADNNPENGDGSASSRVNKSGNTWSWGEGDGSWGNNAGLSFYGYDLSYGSSYQNYSNGLSHGPGGSSGGSNSDNGGYTDNPERPDPNKAQLVQQDIDQTKREIDDMIKEGIIIEYENDNTSVFRYSETFNDDGSDDDSHTPDMIGSITSIANEVYPTKIGIWTNRTLLIYNLYQDIEKGDAGSAALHLIFAAGGMYTTLLEGGNLMYNTDYMQKGIGMINYNDYVFYKWKYEHSGNQSDLQRRDKALKNMRTASNNILRRR